MSEANREPSVFDTVPLRTDHPKIWAGLQEVSAKLDALVRVVGQPATEDGGQPATGIFAHLRDHKNRITRFERLWERAVGFTMCALPAGTALWWLAGDKLAKLFH